MRKAIQRLQYGFLASVFTLVISFSGLVGVLSTRIAYAANEDLSAVANKTVAVNTPAAITDLQVVGEDNENVSVMIYAVNGEFFLDDTNITANGIGTSSLTLNGNKDDINASLSTLTYLMDGRGTSTITVSLGSNVADVIIDPNSGRAYTIIEDELTWNEAREAALQLEYGGVQGYLANVTSEEEDAFIVANLSGNGWIGASDYDPDGGEGNGEGDWKWMDGPEAGTSFWSGAGAGNGGQAVNDEYSNWNLNEPNDSDDEDCAEYIVGQGWNDLSCYEEWRSYVVEFGAADAPDPIERTFTVTAIPETQSVTNCDQLFALTEDDVYKKIELTADIDCQGRTEAPLFDEEDFYGIFEGNGFTIKNLTLANEDGEHVGLTGYSVGAEYRNIFIDNITVTGAFHNGVLAGHVEDSIIAENIHATNVTMTDAPDGEDYAYVDSMGVLFGTMGLEHEAGESRIEHVSVQGQFIIDDVEYVENIGGLIGELESEGDLVIKQAYTDVDIVISNVEYPSERVGGLIGYWYVDGEDSNPDKDMMQGITDSYSWGTITAPDGEYVGGLIGYIENDAEDDADMTFVVNNSYSWMDITAGANVGGLIGYVEDIDYEDGSYGYEVNNSFYAGTLSGDADAGIIIGVYSDYEEEDSTLTFNNVWYDANKVEGYDCVSNLSVDECNAANTDGTQPNYFINNKTHAPMDAWDFDTIWKTQAGTPPVFKPFIGNDGDQDGANDYIENRAPNNGDGNNDGTLDSEQSHVASFVNPETGKYITLALSEACSITNVSVLQAADVTQQDAQYTYANGLVNFSADCGEEGFTTNVTVYHHGVSKAGLTVRKYNPNTGEYFTITNASLADQTIGIGGQNAAVVTYQVTDGGELDIDGEADGSITDPVGLGATIASGTGSSAGDLASTGQQAIKFTFIAVLLVFGSLVVLLALRRTTHRQTK